MIIDEKKHFITIPRDEYENLKNIVDEFNANTITINCFLHIYLKGKHEIYGFTPSLNQPLSYLFSSIIDTSLPQEQIKIIEKGIIDEIVKHSIEEAVKNEQRMNKALIDNLSEIKSKWWYKLFNR